MVSTGVTFFCPVSLVDLGPDVDFMLANFTAPLAGGRSVSCSNGMDSTLRAAFFTSLSQVFFGNSGYLATNSASWSAGLSLTLPGSSMKYVVNDCETDLPLHSYSCLWVGAITDSRPPNASSTTSIIRWLRPMLQ